MPRQPRIHFEGANYHVFSRGNGGKDIFKDDSDRRFFLAELLDLKQTRGLIVHAYCVMTNHFHLLAEVGRHSLAKLMQVALGHYAKHFNIRYETYGHVFQGRHNALLVNRNQYFLTLLRYIHMNPVEAGIVSSPDDWPWSSHRALAFGAPDPLVDPATSLALFGADISAARSLYRKFVGEWKPEEFQPEFAEPPTHIEPACKIRDLREIAENTLRSTGISLDQMIGRSQCRQVTAVRHDFVRTAWLAGFGGSEIARFLDRSPSSVTNVLKRQASRTVNL